ncbi:hypothetical protein F2Q70_00040717 [Brassica cretica]|uniref:Uncharacterized protein n=1 Tax=Brassica cretica TaxID=69181 RepID=A0A8S9K396_BRACR|nr:hypothetical protein F2Q70_00040717 [Brassica cretica]
MSPHPLKRSLEPHLKMSHTLQEIEIRFDQSVVCGVEIWLGLRRVINLFLFMIDLISIDSVKEKVVTFFTVLPAILFVKANKAEFLRLEIRFVFACVEFVLSVSVLEEAEYEEALLVEMDPSKKKKERKREKTET